MTKKERKAERVAIMVKYEIEKQKKKFPNKCFCEDYKRLESDQFIRKETIGGAHPIYSPDPREIDIRKCSKCGKEYADMVIVAYA